MWQPVAAASLDRGLCYGKIQIRVLPNDVAPPRRPLAELRDEYEKLFARLRGARSRSPTELIAIA